MTRRILVALGGNAILAQNASAQAQQQALRTTARSLVELVKNGDELILSHGNGPQVGNLLLQQAAGSTDTNPAMPIDTAVAMTQGSIGYWLQNAMDAELQRNQLPQMVATVITQVEVAASDPAFNQPTKPIGPFYDAAGMAEQKALHPEYQFKEDAGRGYRRVVPSPKPINVVEAETVETLVNHHIIPVAVGGGGVPVVSSEYGLVGQEAVIDKDFASAKLAEQIHADRLLILTAVDHVFVNFNQPDQRPLKRVTVRELETFIRNNQFAAGSMLPKVQAAMEFVRNGGAGTEAVITSLANVGGYLQTGDATIVIK